MEIETIDADNFRQCFAERKTAADVFLSFLGIFLGVWRKNPLLYKVALMGGHLKVFSNYRFFKFFKVSSYFRDSINLS